MYFDYYDDEYNEYENSEEYNEQMESFNEIFWEGQVAYKQLISSLEMDTNKDIA